MNLLKLQIMPIIEKPDGSKLYKLESRYGMPERVVTHDNYMDIFRGELHICDMSREIYGDCLCKRCTLIKDPDSIFGPECCCAKRLLCPVFQGKSYFFYHERQDQQ